MVFELTFDKSKRHPHSLKLANNIKLALALQLASKNLKVTISEHGSEIALSGTAGFKLFDGNAILRYLLCDFEGLESEESNYSLELLEVLLHSERNNRDHVTEAVSNAVNLYLGRLEGPQLATRLIIFANAYALSQEITTKNIGELPEYVIKALSLAKAQTPRSAVAVERTGRAHLKDFGFIKERGKEILPKDGERNILITSSLPYVNNFPHLGNVIGSVLSADVYSRYSRARNYNTLYVCGTDEYGTATETKALELGITPRELCDKYYSVHCEIYEWFQIDFDIFGRTTTEKQSEVAHDIFMKLYNNGYLQEQTMTQLYCSKHKGFLADRYVEGECPKCHYDDARGDQCDKCGGLLDPFELINPRCKLDNFTPESRTSQHIFFSMDKLEPQLVKWVEKTSKEGFWSKNSKTIVNSWLREGLIPRCITRDLVWGTTIPLEKFKNKVMYVWFDAPIGYVSITANYTDQWKKWWLNPENVSLYQFMGKDNVPFHTVVFPATQIGTGDNWTMLHHISTTEYLQYEGGKFSKSRNVGVFGNNAKETGIPSDVWRFYLLSIRPESSDSQFSWNGFVTKNNSELLANLGNFVNRLVKFVNTKYNGVVPEYDVKNVPFEKLNKDINEILTTYINEMELTHLRRGLELAMSLSARGNQFLQENKLDNTLFSEFPEKSDALVGIGLNIIYAVASVFGPFMPKTAETIYRMLNVRPLAINSEFTLIILPGHNINKPEYLFQRIDEAKIEEWREKYKGN